jgi:hypothetical protein
MLIEAKKDAILQAVADLISAQFEAYEKDLTDAYTRHEGDRKFTHSFAVTVNFTYPADASPSAETKMTWARRIKAEGNSVPLTAQTDEQNDERQD